MIHECNIHCHSMDEETMDQMGLDEDPGKWLPFAFKLEIVKAIKMTSDDDRMLKGCTTLFTEMGESYIIDTPFVQFSSLFRKYNNSPLVEKSAPSL